MTDVIIIGAGGHAAEIDEYIKHTQGVTGKKKINIIGFLDDDPASYARYRLTAPFLGSIADHKVIKGHEYIIGIANLQYRRLFVDRFRAGGGTFVSFVHCGAYVSGSATIGEGSIIGPNANIGPNVKVGKYTLINSRCSLGHDTVVGDYNFISPNVCFSGFTEIGDENLFGINSATIPGIKVGNRNKITAGMIIDKDVGDDSVVFHRFKEKIIAMPK
ncbi:MAG: acetyltransferase [Bacteroidales bacterium]|nr:acetyltransferase [Bacteroidales bacterium]